MNTATLNATPTKLRSGEWGAKVADKDVREGDAITITTKSGKSWTAIVQKVIWTGDDVAIVSTRSVDTRTPRSPRGSRTRGTWTGCHCGSVEEFPKPTDCSWCEHDRL